MFRTLILAGLALASSVSFAGDMKHVRICNYSNHKVYCALGGYSSQADTDVSRGWWNIENGECLTAHFEIGGAYMAYCNSDSETRWDGERFNNREYFCIRRDRFQLFSAKDHRACESAGGEMVPFFPISQMNFNLTLRP